jgi:hypothetical protein
MNNLTNLGFTGVQTPNNRDGSMAQVSESRAVAEVQAQYVIAKKFPRDENASYMRIMKACERPFLAEQATYVYPKGGTSVTGPSIRLAEAMAQAWGNIDCGVREVSQSDGMSVAEAYAIDLETNTRTVKTFHVPHTRDTKQGKKKLTDSRDIYEAVANQGARRLRACILAVIPGDVCDAAVAQCEKTLRSSDVPIEDQIRKLVMAFDEIGVKTDHLEKRLGHKLDATIPQEIVTLRGIYKSIKDGMADRSQFFEIASVKGESAREELLQAVGKNKKELVNEPEQTETTENETGV